MNKIGEAGNKGSSVRSDCFVAFERKKNGGIVIEVKSKVEKLFGDDIKKLCKDELSYFGIKNARVTIEDVGALPFVLMARIESAIKKVIDTDKQYIPKMLSENKYSTEKDKFRRSRLYLPGNTPKLMLNAGIHRPDGIILDLEDSVSPSKKDEARILVRNALCQVNFYGAERMVRINQIPTGLEDLEFVVPYHVNLILIPKCENADQVQIVDEKINEISTERGIDYPVYLMPIIESAKGVINAYEIATASKNVVAMAIGLEDYTADIGAQRSKDGKESFFARSQLVNAARAAGIQPIDSVFSDVSDMDALRDVVLESKSMGFDGMGCIHPRQIKVIHEGFAPTDTEIEKAKKIVRAFIEANEKGLGVVSVGSKMIDPPVVKRAQKIIDLAVSIGKLDKNWRDEDGK